MPLSKPPDVPKARPFPPMVIGQPSGTAEDDVAARRRKAKGRRASRVTTPGTLAISDVNILRPELKERLG